MSPAPRFALLRRRYGAGPWHLAAHLLALALVAFAAFAIDRNAGGPALAKLIALYVAFVVAHDLLLLPAYSAMDRLARAVLARDRDPDRHRGRDRDGRRVPVINHLRAPALISGLLLLIYAPLISGRADREYRLVSGHPATGYLRNWLLVSAALFLGSGLSYALRVRRAARSRP